MADEVPGTEAPVVAEAPVEGGATPAAPAVETPAQDGSTPETPKEADKPEGTPKWLQRKIDKATRQRYQEKARADFLEQRLAKLEQQQRPSTPDPSAPQISQYQSVEEYDAAVRKHEREQTTKEFAAKQNADITQRQVSQVTSAWEAKAERGAEKYDDFDEAVGDLKPVDHLSFAIMDEDNGDDVAYHLVKHIDELKAIMAMTPNAQIRAIGKLSARLMAEPAKPKEPSKAPAPITPVGGKSGGANDLPQDSDDITTWMKKENKRLSKQAGLH